MRNLLLLTSFCLASCMNSKKINNSDAFLAEWQSSQSPCIDGLIVNMAANGCIEIKTVQVPGLGYIQIACGNPELYNDSEPYLSHTFIAAPGHAELPHSSQFICHDGNITLGFVPANMPAHMSPEMPALSPDDKDKIKVP